MYRFALIMAGFICVTALPLQAQGIEYGVKGGLNLSEIVISNYIDPDSESDYRMKAGLLAGIYASVDVDDRFVLLAEAQYSSKGVKAITNINLHYFAIPLLLQYRLNKKWKAELGPEFGYLMAARSKYGDVSSTFNNRIDIGLDAGLAYELGARAGVGARYNAGFSSVVRIPKNGGTMLGEPVRYQNRVLQFYLYYKLGERGG